MSHLLIKGISAFIVLSMISLATQKEQDTPKQDTKHKSNKTITNDVVKIQEFIEHQLIVKNKKHSPSNVSEINEETENTFPQIKTLTGCDRSNKEGCSTIHIAEVQIKNNQTETDGSLNQEGVTEILKSMEIIKGVGSKIQVDKLNSGYFSVNIYKITVKEINSHTGNEYILKEPKIFNEEELEYAKEELKNTRLPEAEKIINEKTLIFNPLLDIKEMDTVDKYLMNLDPVVKKTIENIQFSTPKGIRFYKDKNGKMRYVILMSLAQGQSAEELLKKKQDLDSALADIGASLGKVHYHLAPEQMQKEMALGKNFDQFQTHGVHGDFHQGNVFFDSKNQKITFIDIGGMTDSIIKPTFPGPDIKLFAEGLCPQLKDQKTCGLVDKARKKFKESYINAYPQKAHATIGKWIDENAFKCNGKPISCG